MVVATLRDTQLLINLAAIRENITHARENLTNGDSLFVVLKANGYGHGAVQVARAAEQAGADGFCVALMDEALELRAAGFSQPILVLGISNPEDAIVAVKNDISMTVSSPKWVQLAADHLKKAGCQTKLKIHLAIDTGMGRIGFQEPAEFADAVYEIKTASDFVEVEGVFTHFATADERNTSYFDSQVTKFKKFMAELSRKPKYVHVANSAASLWHKACGGNMIRLGIAAYGLNPSQREITSTPYPLKPALSLESNLVYVKKVKKGSHIGYGATYEAAQDEWIGTVPIGYADGLCRKLQGFSVLVDGHKCEIVGRVCMDQIMIRLDKEYQFGEPVVIIGKSGDAEINVEDLAEYVGTINYEIICGFSDRLKRKYV
ncbi:alanine racemase [Lentilactobacillus sp. Marseille-Q4993]|uniref:alanine racemase n=1 Tax=Lentilactobacillus sp. Marseille-Q4993 TaxID=3039492 RepID=UPI0024BC604B|nr:alanine racemase [Lentilactobacillus sp. Marseille-Q4993]